MPFKLLYITCCNQDEAEKIAHDLVSNHLVACVNILPGVTSVYSWEGKTERAQELLLLCKTLSKNIPAVVEAVKAHHSYDIPCIMAVPILGGHPEYLAWVARESPGKDATEVHLPQESRQSKSA